LEAESKVRLEAESKVPLGDGDGCSDSLKNEFLIFKKNSNDLSLENSNSVSNTYNNKYIELDASDNQILNISDINDYKEKILGAVGAIGAGAGAGGAGGGRGKGKKGIRNISIEPSYNKDSILNNSKIYKLTKL
jgi:hypothetical protein